jgi:hypothetical protein
MTSPTAVRAAVRKGKVQASAGESTSGHIPKWIYRACTKAERATPEGQLPFAAIEPKDPADEREILMVIRASEFLRYFRTQHPEMNGARGEESSPLPGWFHRLLGGER